MSVVSCIVNVVVWSQKMPWSTPVSAERYWGEVGSGRREINCDKWETLALSGQQNKNKMLYTTVYSHPIIIIIREPWKLYERTSTSTRSIFTLRRRAAHRVALFVLLLSYSVSQKITQHKNHNNKWKQLFLHLKRAPVRESLDHAVWERQQFVFIQALQKNTVFNSNNMKIGSKVFAINRIVNITRH